MSEVEPKVNRRDIVAAVIALIVMLIIICVGLPIVITMAETPMPPDGGFVILGKEIRSAYVTFQGEQPYYVFQYSDDSRCWVSVPFDDYLHYDVGDFYNKTIIWEAW